MRVSFLDYLRCPDTGGKLRLEIEAERAGEIYSGRLMSLGNNKVYSIHEFIPRFVEPENYASSFGLQWNIHRKTQLDSYTGLTVSRDRLFETSGWSSNLNNQLILEAGAGAGRFTEVLLSTGAKIFSFDYSNAVDANWANNGSNSRLHLFQGDIFNIPFPEGIFDKVICLGVLQHTPDPAKAFRCLAKMVKPGGGKIVIDIYRADIAAYLSWKYLLRPFTKRMNKEKLYRAISNVTPHLIPAASALRRIAGRVGARLVPIVEYSHLGLSDEINREWSILDTYDRYSPVHDHPQKVSTVRHWLLTEGFSDITVQQGFNGIIAKATRTSPSAEI